MPYRNSPDLPRLSGRRDSDAAPQPRETQRVFRRFFDLLERLDRPHPGQQPPDSKAGNNKAGQGRTTRR